MPRRSASTPEDDGVTLLYGPDGQEYRTSVVAEATRLRARGYSETPPEQQQDAPVDTSGALPNPEE